MRVWVLAAALVAVGMAGSPLVAQTIEQGDVKFRVLGRVQAQFSTTSIDEDELIAAGHVPSSAIPASQFETRRIRLGAEAVFRGWLTGKLESELGMARLQIRDAYLNMAFEPGFQLRMGQFKKPFSLLQLTSSSAWPVIERGVRIRGLGVSMFQQDSAAGGAPVMQTFGGAPVLSEEQDMLDVFLYQNFDLGAVVHGEFDGFGYSVGVFNGTGSDRADDTNGKSFAGRVTYKLPTAWPVTLGAAVSHREFRVTNRPAIQTEGGTAFEADVELGAFRKQGLHFLGEVVVGENLAQPDDDFLGAQGILSYFHPTEGKVEGLEFAGRVSYGDARRDVSDDEGLLLTPGVNLYFFGRNRLMFNWDVFLTSDRFTTENALRAQAQFYF